MVVVVVVDGGRGREAEAVGDEDEDGGVGLLLRRSSNLIHSVVEVRRMSRARLATFSGDPPEGAGSWALLSWVAWRGLAWSNVAVTIQIPPLFVQG